MLELNRDSLSLITGAIAITLLMVSGFIGAVISVRGKTRNNLLKSDRPNEDRT